MANQLDLERYRQAKQVTLLGFYSNIFLGFLKIIVGIWGNSQALFADGIHSFSDLLTDMMVLFATKAGSYAPDEEHPYGHGRIETLIALILSLIIVGSGVWIIVDAIIYVLHVQHLHPRPSIFTIVIAVLSVALNEGLYHFNYLVGKRVNSNLLQVNAWHHRIDSLSSFIVLIGVIAAVCGVVFMDSLAAIAVGLLVIKIGISLIWSSAKELIDTGLAADATQRITQSITQIKGVKSLHQLRTRSLGGSVFTDVHIQVHPDITVSEGHYLADKVYRQLKEEGLKISEVLVHVDAEDDREEIFLAKLPDREAIQQELADYFQDSDLFANIMKINLHYLNKAIGVELFFPLEVLDQKDKLKTLREKANQVHQVIEHISKIDLFFGQPHENSHLEC